MVSERVTQRMMDGQELLPSGKAAQAEGVTKGMEGWKSITVCLGKYKWLALAWEEDGKVGKDKILKAPQALLKSLNLIF